MNSPSSNQRMSQQVLRLTSEQCGVVRRDQLHDLGVPPRTLARRIDEGLWIPRGRRVLVFAATPDTLLTESLISAHAFHPESVLTGFSALAVRGELGKDPWSVVAPESRPWVLLPTCRKTSARVLRVPVGPTQPLMGVRVASRDQIIADLLRLLSAGEAQTLAYRLAQRMRAATVVAIIEKALEGLGQAPGAQQLKGMIRSLSNGAQSEAEQEIISILMEAGFQGFIANYPTRIRGRLYRIDVAFPEYQLAIEVDGFAFHSTSSQLQGSNARQNDLVSDGWTVQRYTWTDLMSTPDVVLRAIQNHLESW